MKRKTSVRKTKRASSKKYLVRGKISLGFLVVGFLAVAVIPTILLSQNRITDQQRASEREVTPVATTPLPCGNLGDANGDGKINQDDAILVNQWVSTWNPNDRQNGEKLVRGDIDGDGRITVTDALFIGRFAAGKEYTFKGCNLPTTPKARVCGAYGDVDGDGQLSLGDANDIGNYVVGNKTFTDYQKKQADVTGDGKVDMIDALMIGNLIVDKPGFQVFKVCAQTKPFACGSLGDVDSDGIITELDATRLGGSVVGNVFLTEDQKKLADVNADGKVDMVDALMIARYAGGMESTLKGCNVRGVVQPSSTILPTSSPMPGSRR